MTFIAHNPSSQAHDLPGHPETARRATAILEAFQQDSLTSRLERLQPDGLVSQEDVLTTHSLRLWHNLMTIEPHTPAFIDPDTYVVAGSVEAARRTARLGMQAVQRAWTQNEAGYVVARPPGHHATHDRSMGFCLLNNVAMAAQHARALGAKRVLIFDHDVHHGNGTQDIFYESNAVLYQSFHLAHHYPGSGMVEEIGRGAGEGRTLNAPLEPGDGEAQVRSLLEQVFLPVAHAFRPDLILFSSGYDSLAGDPLGGLQLSPAFFGEMVARFRRIQPRLVCFLEGGYQLDVIPRAALAQVHALDGAPSLLGNAQRAPRCEASLMRAVRPHWPL